MAKNNKIIIKKPFSAPARNRVYQLTASALLGIALYLTALYLAPLQKLHYTEEMMEAARIMDRAITIIQTFKKKKQYPHT